MNFFAGFSLPSQAILENVGQEARLKDAEKGAESAGLKYWDRLMHAFFFPILSILFFSGLLNPV
jgi:hypothetical protein